MICCNKHNRLAGTDVEKLESSSLQVGTEYGVATLINGLIVPHMVQHTVAIRSNKYTYRYIPKRIKNIHPHKNVYMNVHSGFL